MTLHFLHVAKTGGTAIKRALRRAGLPETPYGPIRLPDPGAPHKLRMGDVPPDDYMFFCVRDPITRFLSGFYSRLNKGQPRYHSEWTEAERIAFEAFPTPQRLAVALASRDDDERELAESAMQGIRHLRFMQRAIGAPAQLEARLDHVAYIGRQETLDADWQQIRSLLRLPERARLPQGPVRAHRRDPSLDTSLDEAALQALRDWYAGDYELLAFCDEVRAERGWGIGATAP